GVRGGRGHAARRPRGARRRAARRRGAERAHGRPGLLGRDPAGGRARCADARVPAGARGLAMSARAMLEVRDVTKRFGAVEAVSGIDFAVGEGEIVGFLGPNGAGKPTAMRILAGIFPPTSGEVRVAGHDPQRHPLACRRAVGYFPEHAPYYPELTVRGYLRLVARLKRLPRATRGDAVARVLAACGLGARGTPTAEP